MSRASKNRATRSHKEVRHCQEADLRATIAHHLATGYSTKDVAERVGVSASTISKMKREDYERLNRIDPTGKRPLMPGPIVPAPGTPSMVEYKKRRLAFSLRKRATPYSEIAEIMGCSVNQAEAWVKEELVLLDNGELSDINLLRRMHLEQIEAMMAAIMTPSTGRKMDGTKVAPHLESMDRMIKLMEQKAKLLGLNAPQTVDINQRIEILAIEFGYDSGELKEIAREVMAQRMGARAITPGTK